MRRIRFWRIKISGTGRWVKYFSEIYLPVREHTWLIGSGELLRMAFLEFEGRESGETTSSFIRWGWYSQFHLGWLFRLLKAQSSNVSFATFQWKETFELWALHRCRRFGRLILTDHCTYGRTRSILTVGSITLEENYGWYQWSVRLIVSKNRSISTIQVASYKVDCRNKIGQRSISTDKFAAKQKRTNDLWSPQWWIMVPDNHPHGKRGGEKWSNTYTKIDTNPTINRPVC